MSLFDLKGRVAVVTVGNGGIGLGMARGMAEAGKSPDAILAFYYRGIQFAQIADRLESR